MPRKNMIVYLDHCSADALEIQNAARADEEDAAHSQDARAIAASVGVLHSGIWAQIRVAWAQICGFSENAETSAVRRKRLEKPPTSAAYGQRSPEKGVGTIRAQ